MKGIQKSGFLALSLAGLLFLAWGTGTSQVREEGWSKVTFYVGCYDVGKEALQPLRGVSRVEKGFHHFKETNIVYFDPRLVTAEEMQKALEKAGTFLGRVNEPSR
jgi:hypothetical protein